MELRVLKGAGREPVGVGLAGRLFRRLAKYSAADASRELRLSQGGGRGGIDAEQEGAMQDLHFWSWFINVGLGGDTFLPA